MAVSAGHLLVAHPRLNNSLFNRSVVLISESHRHGHVGFLLNKPTSHAVETIGEQRGITLHSDQHIHMGGPVNRSALTLIHTDEWYSSNTMVLGNGLAISSDQFMIEKLSMGNAPRQWRFVSGMSGWHPGQLEEELKGVTGWLTLPATPELTLNKDGSKQWEQCIDAVSHMTFSSYL